jgi:hypothetical protein
MEQRGWLSRSQLHICREKPRPIGRLSEFGLPSPLSLRLLNLTREAEGTHGTRRVENDVFDL